jgi:hypothetical protein
MNARSLFPCQRNLGADPPLKSYAKVNLAEPAEPSPTHSTETPKHMFMFGKSSTGRFRWFRCKAFLWNVWEKVPLVPLCRLPIAEKGSAQ